jgi:hypothetical protein
MASRACTAAVLGLSLGVLDYGGMTAAAAEVSQTPTTQELIEQIEALKTKVDQLETSQSKNESKLTKQEVDRTVGDVLADAERADYFELKKDGKIYILGSSASREAFNNGQMPPLNQTTFDNGKAAFVEDSNYNDYNRLVAEYKKAKGL